MTGRAAKSNALKAIHSSIEEVVEEIDNEPETCLNFQPTVTQNAPDGMSLDLNKQYKRKVECCDREVIRIHNKALNKKDQGSADGGLVYVDFQAGLFEALRLNFFQCIEKDYGIVPVAQPKIELYGNAEERICLDL